MRKFEKPVKRILYLLASRKSSQQLRELNNHESNNGCSTTLSATTQILRRLIEKGVVARSEFGDGYYLTDKGKEVAKSIVDEIDEYKRW